MGSDTSIVQTVREAVRRNNAAIPHQPVTLPSYVFLTDYIAGAMYSPESDSLVIDINVLFYPEEELLAIILHELDHKIKAESGLYEIVEYDSPSHVRAVAPNLQETCSQAGLSEQEVKKALPSQAVIEHIRWMLFDAAVPPNAQTIPRMRKIAQDLLLQNETPLQSPVDASSEQEWQKCEAGVERVEDSLFDALLSAYHQSNSMSREHELEADDRARIVLGADPMARALHRLLRGEVIADSDFIDEVFLTHPKLATRIEALGCAYHPGADDEVVCPDAPHHANHAPSDRLPTPSFNPAR